MNANDQAAALNAAAGMDRAESATRSGKRSKRGGGGGGSSAAAAPAALPHYHFSADNVFSRMHLGMEQSSLLIFDAEHTFALLGAHVTWMKCGWGVDEVWMELDGSVCGVGFERCRVKG
eukprot:362603-Chlamydomonas_euryale.AAC.2